MQQTGLASHLTDPQAAHTLAHSPKIGWSGSLAWSSFRVCAKHWKAMRECLDAAACTAACCAGVVAASSTTCAALTRGAATTILGGCPGLGCFAWAVRSLKNLAGSDRDMSHSVAVNSRSFGHPGGRSAGRSAVFSRHQAGLQSQHNGHTVSFCAAGWLGKCDGLCCLAPHLLLQLL